MNKSVAFALIVLVIVGTVFGIQYITENYNNPNDNNDNPVQEEKLEDIIPTLTIPKLYETIIDIQSLFYDFETLSVENMSNAMKLSLVVNNIYDKRYDMSDDGTVKISGKDVKEYYQKLYGNIEYVPETFTFFERDVCTMVYEYHPDEDYYLIKLPGCGGRLGPAVWEPYIRKDKELKEGNHIYIDYYVASYVKIDDDYYEQYPEEGQEQVTIYNKIFENKIYMGKEINDKVINDLMKQNQISKYRLTYEKQSDGKYYFKSGAWIENTLE